MEYHNSNENVQNNPIIIGSELILGVLRNMKDRKEITLEQYADNLRRAKEEHHTVKDSCNRANSNNRDKLNTSIPRKVYNPPSEVFKILGIDYIG